MIVFEDQTTVQGKYEDITRYKKMTLEEKQIEITEEFEVFDDWIRENDSFRRPNDSAREIRGHY